LCSANRTCVAIGSRLACKRYLRPHEQTAERCIGTIAQGFPQPESAMDGETGDGCKMQSSCISLAINNKGDAVPHSLPRRERQDRRTMPKFFLSDSLDSCIKAALVLCLVALCGCATPMPRKDDPYENFNRKMYAFNDFADRVAIRPVAVGYRKVTNDTSRRLISNFFANIESPITIANDLLQANPKEAFKATSRFAINTTIGLLGFFDPASEMSIDVSKTDFGVTLAKWGVAEGPYLVLPLIGSTTSRDIAAFPVDRFLLDPLSWYASSHDLKYSAEYLPTVAYLVTLRSSAIDAEGLLEGVYDPYVFYRDAYRQRRLYKIYRGNPPMEAIQSLQGVDDVDVDALLKEQEKFEQQHKGDDGKPPESPRPNPQKG
jgi:phospholipid-binding lipoprotein MlaA